MRKISFLAILLWSASAFAQLDGPFGLYTVSSDPAWTNRPLTTNPAQPWFIVQEQVQDPSEIHQINFFINTTDGTDLPRGFLTWGGSDPFSDQYGVIQTIDPNVTYQPISFIPQWRGLPNYSDSWTFGRNGQLVLTGLTRFFVKVLKRPLFNDWPVVWWQFGAGPVADPEAIEVIILRHDP